MKAGTWRMPRSGHGHIGRKDALLRHARSARRILCKARSKLEAGRRAVFLSGGADGECKPPGRRWCGGYCDGRQANLQGTTQKSRCRREAIPATSRPWGGHSADALTKWLHGIGPLPET